MMRGGASYRRCRWGNGVTLDAHRGPVERSGSRNGLPTICTAMCLVDQRRVEEENSGLEMRVLPSGSEDGSGTRSVGRMRVFERKNCSSVELTRKVQDKEMAGEQKMRVSSTKSRSRCASHNGKAPGGFNPGRQLPYIYVCVCVEYRHLYARLPNQESRVRSRSS